jgi:hypothetical protein
VPACDNLQCGIEPLRPEAVVIPVVELSLPWQSLREVDCDGLALVLS